MSSGFRGYSSAQPRAAQRSFVAESAHFGPSLDPIARVG